MTPPLSDHPSLTAFRDDDTARLATERVGFQRAAAAAEADAAELRGQLAAAQAALAEEKQRSEHLAASMWPLAAKIKSLEAAAAAAAAAMAGGAAAGGRGCC